jgi:NCS1 family nucleobase:cation symporter-1
MALFAFIGAAVTNATLVIFGSRIADPVALLARIGGPFMIMLSMAGLIVATLTTNIAANIVAPANAFSNLAPHRITFKQGAMITAVIGILMMPWRLYNDAAAYIFTWLIGYGALLGPVAGIMIADYFVLRRGVLHVNDLYRRGGAYEYARGFNWVAVAALACGVLPSIPGFVAALQGRASGGFFGAIYNWAWFVGFLVASAVHIVGMRLTGGVRESPEARVAV